ncbi:hypothetical protein J2X19_000728 [Rhodoferax ferrireducens]|uniref:DUF4259 domain-containing protein n=1 Tax=Rhodoferax ferrireducens TaxID=192843 RepID=A0ABU2C415_9BURK|nr:DUF4259 domain-containing protein [Rhodoferax ferrireducens]MDR7376070.1 hypothetical protein [Rhodoferax ferrireducens]
MNYLKQVGVALFMALIGITANAGTWGEGPFDNDDAQDWLAECSRSATPAVISQAIESALKPGPVDATEGSIAIAAAEVVAAAHGKGIDALNAQVAPCLAKKPTTEIRALAPQARKVVARVADPNSSELAQLWAEGKPNRWALGLTRLAARLQP